MKKVKFFLLIASLAFLTACKKDHVDASSTQSLQTSINDMTSSLTTLQQIKFNEALYVLKTFGVEADGDVNELKALGKLIDGKKVPEILSLADQVAQKNGMDWSSTASPSLGEMDIFGDLNPKEVNSNDVRASSVTILTKYSGDTGTGPTAIQIIPRLVDGSGKPVTFSGATLETTLEVFNNGVKLSTARNIMQDNNFKGFYLKFSSLSAERITDGKIDITISIKTATKTFKMSKIGQEINPSALRMPEPPKVDSTATTNPTIVDPAIPAGTATDPTTTTPASPKSPSTDPKTTVSRFLNNVSTQNLKAAFDASSNPSWGNYDAFSNPTSGFGAVKNVSVKNITTNASNPNAASVNATYDVTDKSGKTTALKVTFGLKNVNGDWKISSYKINP
jgi:hypothetical protein